MNWSEVSSGSATYQSFQAGPGWRGDPPLGGVGPEAGAEHVGDGSRGPARSRRRRLTAALEDLEGKRGRRRNVTPSEASCSMKANYQVVTSLFFNRPTAGLRSHGLHLTFNQTPPRQRSSLPEKEIENEDAFDHCFHSNPCLADTATQLIGFISRTPAASAAPADRVARQHPVCLFSNAEQFFFRGSTANRWE